MNLWYISVGLDNDSFETFYCYEFTKHTRFISNYLTRKIRKIGFKTDGSFRMISVNLVPSDVVECEIVFGDVLRVQLPFDNSKYERAKGTDDCEYYLDVFERGFRVAAEFREIPLGILCGLINEFRENGCKNEWLHKKRVFKKRNLEVELRCDFNTLNFTLTATIRSLLTKQVLCSGIVLTTDPDELAFDYKFKNVKADESNIIITNHVDLPSFLINIKSAQEGRFLVTEVV